VRPIDLDLIVDLYEKYAEPLADARDAQRELLARFRGPIKAQLDDIEAEITYLLVRDTRPETVVEIGALHGWSASWILRALVDNGTGHLFSYDLIDSSERTLPAELAEGRRTFVHGDVKERWRELESSPDYVFIDAAHSARFARWYLRQLFPGLRSGIRVSVHDVFHFRRPVPLSEGAVLMRHLSGHGMRYFTAAPARARQTYQRLLELRRDLRLDRPVRTSTDNPMVYFTLQ
jgi:predicted O-methyltransferase YrrM